MTTLTQQPLPHQVKYCPMLQKDCIRDKCAWYLKQNEAHLPTKECAVFVLAAKIATMSRQS